MAADKKTFIRNAQKQVQKGQLDRAITTYKAILKLDPNDVKVHNTLGDLYIRKNQKKEGVAEYLWVADYYEKDGFFLRSIAICQKILNLDADMVEVRLKLADLYTQQRLAAEAKKQYLLVADYYEKKGMMSEALESFSKLADLDPGNLQIRIRLGSSYEKQGFPNKAAREYARVAEGLIKSGSADKAGELLDKAIKISPENSDCRRVKADLHATKEEWDKVAEMLEPLANAEEADVQIFKTYAGACLKTGQVPQAIAALERAQREEPASFPLMTLLGQAYIEGREFQKARTLYGPLIEEFLKEEKFEAAEDLGRQLVDADPTSEEGLRTLIGIVEKAGNQAETATAHARLAALLETEGDTKGAEASFLKVLELRPDDAAAAEALQRLRGAEAAAPEAEAEVPAVEPVGGEEKKAAEEVIPDLPGGGDIDLEADGEMVIDEEEVEISLEDDEEEGDLPSGEPVAEEVPEAPAAVAAAEETGEGPAMAPASQVAEEPAPAPEEQPPQEPSPTREGDLPADFVEAFELEDSVDPGTVDLSAVVGEELADLGATVSTAEEAAVEEPTAEEERADPGATVSTAEEAAAEEPAAVETETAEESVEAEAFPDAASPVDDAFEVDLDAFDGLTGDETDGADLFSSDEVSELVQEGILDGSAEEEGAGAPAPGESGPAEPVPAADTADVSTAAAGAVDMDAKPPGDLDGLVEGGEPVDAVADSPPECVAVHSENEELEEFLAEADFYMQQGLTDEAEFLYQKLVKLAPDNAEIAERLEKLQSGKTGAAEDLPEEPIIPREEIVALESDLDRVLGAEAETAPKAKAPTGPLDEAARKLTVSDGEGHGDTSEFSDFLSDLKDDLDDNEVPEPTPAAADEQSLSEIFQEFQEGLREQLGEEDFETHYNLGIAYKEMGLMQEALGEFRLSEKSEARRMDSISMIALCHREMGSIDESIAKLKEGLAMAVAGTEEEKGLQYDLGDTLFQEGREDEAREIFQRLYESSPDYRDVAERVRMSGQKPPPVSDAEGDPGGSATDSGQSRVSYL